LIKFKSETKFLLLKIVLVLINYKILFEIKF
jgi:hypothetical protein